MINQRRNSEIGYARYSGRWKAVPWNNISNPAFATLVAKAAAALHNICQARCTENRQGWEADTHPNRIRKEQERAQGMRRAFQAARRAVVLPAEDAAEDVRRVLVAYVGAHR